MQLDMLMMFLKPAGLFLLTLSFHGILTASTNFKVSAPETSQKINQNRDNLNDHEVIPQKEVVSDSINFVFDVADIIKNETKSKAKHKLVSENKTFDAIGTRDIKTKQSEEQFTLKTTTPVDFGSDGEQIETVDNTRDRTSGTIDEQNNDTFMDGKSNEEVTKIDGTTEELEQNNLKIPETKSEITSISSEKVNGDPNISSIEVFPNKQNLQKIASDKKREDNIFITKNTDYVKYKKSEQLNVNTPVDSGVNDFNAYGEQFGTVYQDNVTSGITDVDLEDYEGVKEATSENERLHVLNDKTQEENQLEHRIEHYKSPESEDDKVEDLDQIISSDATLSTDFLEDTQSGIQEMTKIFSKIETGDISSTQDNNYATIINILENGTTVRYMPKTELDNLIVSTPLIETAESYNLKSDVPDTMDYRKEIGTYTEEVGDVETDKIDITNSFPKAVTTTTENPTPTEEASSNEQPNLEEALNESNVNVEKEKIDITNSLFTTDSPTTTEEASSNEEPNLEQEQDPTTEADYELTENIETDKTDIPNSLSNVITSTTDNPTTTEEASSHEEPNLERKLDPTTEADYESTVHIETDKTDRTNTLSNAITYTTENTTKVNDVSTNGEANLSEEIKKISETTVKTENTKSEDSHSDDLNMEIHEPPTKYEIGTSTEIYNINNEGMNVAETTTFELSDDDIQIEKLTINAENKTPLSGEVKDVTVSIALADEDEDFLDNSSILTTASVTQLESIKVNKFISSPTHDSNEVLVNFKDNMEHDTTEANTIKHEATTVLSNIESYSTKEYSVDDLSELSESTTLRSFEDITSVSVMDKTENVLYVEDKVTEESVTMPNILSDLPVSTTTEVSVKPTFDSIEKETVETKETQKNPSELVQNDGTNTLRRQGQKSLDLSSDPTSTYNTNQIDKNVTSGTMIVTEPTYTLDSTVTPTQQPDNTEILDTDIINTKITNGNPVLLETTTSNNLALNTNVNEEGSGSNPSDTNDMGTLLNDESFTPKQINERLNIEEDNSPMKVGLYDGSGDKQKIFKENTPIILSNILNSQANFTLAIQTVENHKIYVPENALISTNNTMLTITWKTSAVNNDSLTFHFIEKEEYFEINKVVYSYVNEENKLIENKKENLSINPSTTKSDQVPHAVSLEIAEDGKQIFISNIDFLNKMEIIAENRIIDNKKNLSHVTIALICVAVVLSLAGLLYFVVRKAKVRKTFKINQGDPENGSSYH